MEDFRRGNRPENQQTTLAAKQRFFNSILDRLGIDEEYNRSHHFNMIIQDFKKVLQLIKTPIRKETLQDDTIKTYFSMLVAELKAGQASMAADISREIKQAEQEMESYDIKHKMAKQANGQKLDDEETWVNWDDLQRIRDYVLRRYNRVVAGDEDINTQIDYPKLPKKAVDYNLYQAYVIMSLFTYISPMRSDYSPVRMARSKPEYDSYVGLADRDASSQGLMNKSTGRLMNVLGIFEDNGVRQVKFYLRDYKTVVSDGPKTLDIKGRLADVLKNWDERYQHGKKYLFTKPKKDVCLEQPEFSALVGKILLQFTGIEGIGINTMRHAFCSYLHSGAQVDTELMRQAAYEMSHSVQMGMTYVRYLKDGRNANERSNFRAPDVDPSGNLYDEDEAVSKVAAGPKDGKLVNLPEASFAIKSHKGTTPETFRLVIERGGKTEEVAIDQFVVKGYVHPPKVAAYLTKQKIPDAVSGL